MSSTHHVYNWAAMDQLRILLVDDHLLFRKGLAQMLSAQPDFVIVGEATHGVEAVELAQQLEPDLVLMDINMPICNGLEATSRIKAQMPKMRVVMLTVSDDEADLADAVRCGADGYLLKDLQPEVLFDQLRRLTSGEPPISQAMTTKLFRQVAQQMAQQKEQMVIQPTAMGDLHRGRSKSSNWSRTAIPTRQSPTNWASPTTRSRTTCAASSPSSVYGIGHKPQPLR